MSFHALQKDTPVSSDPVPSVGERESDKESFGAQSEYVISLLCLYFSGERRREGEIKVKWQGRSAQTLTAKK